MTSICNLERAKSLEHYFLLLFLFFSVENRKGHTFSPTFFGSLRRFLHSLHCSRFGPWSLPLRSVRPSLGRPPGLAHDSQPFATDSTTLRSFRSVRSEKSFGIQKSVRATQKKRETRPFFRPPPFFVPKNDRNVSILSKNRC